MSNFSADSIPLSLIRVINNNQDLKNIGHRIQPIDNGIIIQMNQLKFWFSIIQHPERPNNYIVEHIPKNELDLKVNSIGVTFDQIKSILITWTKLMLEYQENINFFNDPIEQYYYDELSNEPYFAKPIYTSPIHPFPTPIQYKLNLFLVESIKYLSELKDSNNNPAIDDCIEYAQELSINMGSLPQKEITSKIQRLLAKSKKIGAEIFYNIVSNIAIDAASNGILHLLQ